jgi:hypothetical protein
VPIGVLVLAAVELAIVIPILDRNLAQQAAGQFLESSVTPLGLVTIVFSIALLAALGVLRSIASGIRLAGRSSAIAQMQPAVASSLNAVADNRVFNNLAAARDSSHPGVVRALESLQRRDSQTVPDRAAPAFARGAPAVAAMGSGSRRPLIASSRADSAFVAPPPLRRPLRNRASRAAKRRDS